MDWQPNGGGTVELNLDPLLIELLKKIPPLSESGWPAAHRVRWFRTFAMNVAQIYDNDSSPIELEINETYASAKVKQTSLPTVDASAPARPSPTASAESPPPSVSSAAPQPEPEC